MNKTNIYFDNAATTKMHPQVLEKMLPYLTDNYGNASAVHSFGRKARVAIEDSREIIADFINANPGEIYFTSGGSESNNFIINGIAKTEFSESGRNHLITSKAEHHAVLHTFEKLQKEGFTAHFIDIDENFLPTLENISSGINNSTSLISLMLVNNETGSLFDLSKIKNKNVYIHTDAVQGFGKIKIDVKKLGVHALSASAHKLYGPKGIGIAYVKSGTPMESFILGGGQERNRRAGTENVASIVGFAEVVIIANANMKENFNKVSSLKNYFIDKLKSNFNQDNIFINSKGNSTPYILSFTLNPDLYNSDSQAMLMNLDVNGIAASSGSACASGTVKPSHVIMASGKSAEYANGTLRFSFNAENTLEEIDYSIDILKRMIEKFKK